MKTKQFLPLAIMALMTISVSSFAQEKESKWDKRHPRRDQVNDRLANQNNRIHNKVQDGQMSKREAGKLHVEDHQIKKEERRMASRHNGHITKTEQVRLDRQENHVSRQIRRH